MEKVMDAIVQSSEGISASAPPVTLRGNPIC